MDILGIDNFKMNYIQIDVMHIIFYHNLSECHIVYFIFKGL